MPCNAMHIMYHYMPDFSGRKRSGSFTFVTFASFQLLWAAALPGARTRCRCARHCQKGSLLLCQHLEATNCQPPKQNGPQAFAAKCFVFIANKIASSDMDVRPDQTWHLPSWQALQRRCPCHDHCEDEHLCT